MSAHTPGPWAVDLSDPDEWGTWMIRGDKDGKYFVGEVYNGNGTPQNLFNARLIAAAPMLLMTLEAICDEFDNDDDFSARQIARHAGRATIAKAKGEA